ncbi:50S ribosomal protein L17 [Leptospira perolatii]|uniref:Large ribosomal subunit protein bL17 n=1 Tax=Leptospira perolatii TaxID=2023191 RepID=A0A2M9ZMH2_9LEPT|nr:50S ribosomal protein L17 [Leptospira perolatii]PJZ69123.1 50S ribosomal protein L17 [Leptospira perolatii]PJZ73133.1 50S ribosomal protein L17 [Leptospira perolatii]
MNKRNKVKHLNREKGHRDALINNMITSLFKYERIESTQAKLKVVRSHAEKIITRAKRNLGDIAPEVKLHNKREVMKRVKDRNIVTKLFEDIAARYSQINGGYTRILKLVNRPSDNSEVGILELTQRKDRPTLIKEIRDKREEWIDAKKQKKAGGKEAAAKKEAAPKKEAKAKPAKAKVEKKPKKAAPKTTKGPAKKPGTTKAKPKKKK